MFSDSFQASRKRRRRISSIKFFSILKHVIQSCFNGRRIVVFSGGEAKNLDGIYKEVTAIRDGGGNGSIIGRNTFQRPKEEAMAMLDHIIKIYQNKA